MRFLKNIWSRLQGYLQPPAPVAPVEIQEVIVHRLSREMYEQLEKNLPKLGTPRTDLEAATTIGVQLVLAELRRGIVVGGY